LTFDDSNGTQIAVDSSQKLLLKSKLENIKGYLITAYDQKRRIGRMENTRMELIANTSELMNTLPFTCSTKRPYPNRVFTHGCQILSRQVPAHRVNILCVTLQQHQRYSQLHHLMEIKMLNTEM
jgi:hypothetical protein